MHSYDTRVYREQRGDAELEYSRAQETPVFAGPGQLPGTRYLRHGPRGDAEHRHGFERCERDATLALLSTESPRKYSILIYSISSL